MKRLLMSCMLLLGIQSVDAQVAKVALSHKGNLTMYNAENLSDALNDALDGDTIFLNEGTFQGGITISKAITLIGAGQNSIIDGNITVSYSGTLKARLLDALNIEGSVSISNSLTGLTIRKCEFKSFSSNGLINAIIDRCYVKDNYFYINNGMKNVQIVNSGIYKLRGLTNNVSDVVFANCNIYSFDGSNSIKATFSNCIVDNANWRWSSDCDRQKDSFFSYCYLKYDNGINTMQNCKTGSIDWSNPGMTGTDGTIVGINGGTTPYTLVPTNPKVNKYSLNVDTQNKKLTVNISVSAN